MDITKSSLEQKIKECADKDEAIDKLREENCNLIQKNADLRTMNDNLVLKKDKIEILIGKVHDENFNLKKEAAETK